jgi:phosphoribosylanthranilate isomerase
MSIKVQIYVRTVEDALMCAAAGSEFVGLVCDPTNLPQSSMPFAQAKEVMAAFGDDTIGVALTASADPGEIAAMARAVEPHVVQLVASKELPPAVVAQLRRALPMVKWMRAIAVIDHGAIALAKSYQSVCDYLILDTRVPGRVDLGGTGQTHDWNISAELVRRVHIPVFLAGGLSPDNVAQSIRAVRPWGVDSFSLTNMPGPGNRKDPAKVQAFVANARAGL